MHVDWLNKGREGSHKWELSLIKVYSCGSGEGAKEMGEALKK